ncbi:acyl-CoA dehydrogenase [Pseudonocardia hydrocarbonoxydans]|uniref:Dehydrogenase n=1 Tax=Pseudonocardia hydrocarbonoxydans TaxID=76726 RepID=A0A4Y3WKY9_9PSEU|nr:acyl-CoA dehydrogenase [Pseudonocardia hydrocarbonoxydans]GEC18901.1 dehydrogenase [Pseudonocardia hydrocarbonoxydans]
MRDPLPLPGHGDTAGRWRTLARWGRTDLVLARLAEGHTDALAILAEAGAAPVPGALYGVWAARSGGTGAELRGTGVCGLVRFCSGAHTLDRALVVAGDRIVEVDVRDPRVRPVEGTWDPVGMAASDSVDVEFAGVPADSLVGPPGFYTARQGFWWGGGGVAAVWLGGAAGIVDDVRGAAGDDPHRLAHLGTLHTALAGTDALLARTADAIDADPAADHTTAVWTARAAADGLARTVADRAPRLAGSTVLTRHDRLGARLADLGVYVRQHHAERDLAALGARVRG